MNAKSIEALVRKQIGDAWDMTNAHRLNLREALVPPVQIVVIDRRVRKGKIYDQLVDVWLVLVEKTEAGDGYRIVAAEDGSMFGLASKGFSSDEHLVLDGWYRDFLSAFRGM